MAKKMRFPRKFRQTLEKVADAKAARETEQQREAKIEGVIKSVMHTMWRDFLGPGSVYVMSTTVDPEHMPMFSTRHTMHQALRHDVDSVSPPWQHDKHSGSV